MRFRNVVLALLAALLIMVLPACALTLNAQTVHHGGAWIFTIGSLLGLVGVVVTYTYPVAGANPPTITQAANCSIQAALVQLLDADTQAAFTHNWGLPASFPGYLFPVIVTRPVLQANAGATLAISLTFNVSNTNVVFINKATGTGSGGTFMVTLLRPHSIIS
jgi:hypothetical protein